MSTLQTTSSGTSLSNVLYYILFFGISVGFPSQALSTTPGKLQVKTTTPKKKANPSLSKKVGKKSATATKAKVQKAKTSPTLLTEFERSRYLKTAHPTKVMDYYKKLAKTTKWLKIFRIGIGDGNRPIHLVVLSKQQIFQPKNITNQIVLMTNNGIHSGESCGVDATQMLMRDLIAKMKTSSTFDRLIYMTIPIFNVGGHIQFRAHNRVNQQGPVQMGFRGNARNYDLNRDFVKADTANMRAFYKAFHTWKPHIFIDNHTTNGSDHQHIMTYTLPPKEALPKPLKTFVYSYFKSGFEGKMKRWNVPLIPYPTLKVRNAPRKGINGWISTPRFSTGLTRLFNTIPILSEAHVLKTYKQRVMGTYLLNKSAILTALGKATQLRKARKDSDTLATQRKTYTIRWKRTKGFDKIAFGGYAYDKKYSPISGGWHVYYDRSKPRQWVIPYFNRFTPALRVKVPKAYIIPQQWKHVIQRLQWNGIRFTRLKKEQKMQVEVTYITHIKWRSRPYEGHFRPYGIKTFKVLRSKTFRKGDIVVSTAQPGSAYIIEVLEAQGADAFLVWNAFDTIFQQKEYFAPYLFHKTAEKILKKDKRLREIFLHRLRKEPNFAKSPKKRLQFIYQSSKYYEPVHNMYPIVRVF